MAISELWKPCHIEINGVEVMTEAQVASAFKVPVEAVTEAVEGNLERFNDGRASLLPEDRRGAFYFSGLIGKNDYPEGESPLIFNKFGFMTVASILNSPNAIEYSHYVNCRAIRDETRSDFNDMSETSQQHIADNIDSVFNDVKRLFGDIRSLVTPPKPLKSAIGFGREAISPGVVNELKSTVGFEGGPLDGVEENGS